VARLTDLPSKLHVLSSNTSISSSKKSAGCAGAGLQSHHLDSISKRTGSGVLGFRPLLYILRPSLKKKKKKKRDARHWWLILVTLATQEAEIKRMVV
jgi:hypothetical protein